MVAELVVEGPHDFSIRMTAPHCPELVLTDFWDPLPVTRPEQVGWTLSLVDARSCRRVSVRQRLLRSSSSPQPSIVCNGQRLELIPGRPRSSRLCRADLHDACIGSGSPSTLCHSLSAKLYPSIVTATRLFQ